AQRSFVDVREQRLLRGVLQCDEPLALQSTRLCGLRRRTHLLRGQAVEILDVVDGYSAIGRGLEQVLPKFAGEGRDLRVERTQPSLVGGYQARAGAHETRMPACQELQRLGVWLQAGALLVHRVDALPQGAIQVDRVAVCAAFGRH